MAFESALRLARRSALPPTAPFDQADLERVTLSRPKRGPFAGFRPMIKPIVAAIPILLTAAGAGAQISSASTAALGLGGNYTGAAVGLDAVAWNPAALGYSAGGSGFVTMSVRGASGFGPVSMRTLSDHSNVLVPNATKREWLAGITADGGQTGSGGADVTWLALRLGRFAVHASSTARMVADVSPGIAELVLFGNVGDSGAASNLDLSGSSLLGFAYSAVGASIGQPYETEAGLASVGVTVKYIVGHGLALGSNSAGAAVANPLGVSADFPLVHTDFENGNYGVDNGHGIAVDVGGSVASDDWTLSGVVQNLKSTFEWKTNRLMYRALSFRLAENEATTKTDAVALASAPAAVQERIRELTFKPVYSAGLAWHRDANLMIAADVRFSSDKGLVSEPTRHVGAGFEYRVADWFPVRMGGAMISMGDEADGWQAGAGLGLELGSWNVSASALRRSAARYGSTTMIMVSLFGAGR